MIEQDTTRPLHTIADSVEPASAPLEAAQLRTRCRIVETATAEPASTADGEGSTETDGISAVKFVPRPSVPTLSNAEILLLKAQDISVRGNPCISRRSNQQQITVQRHFTLCERVVKIFGLRSVLTPESKSGRR